MKKALLSGLALLLVLAFTSCASLSDAAKKEQEAAYSAKEQDANGSGSSPNSPSKEGSSSDYEGTYTGDNVTVRITENSDGTFYVEVEDGFHDSLDGTLEGNSIVLHRVINTTMMPEAENPYDEQTTITLTKGSATDGAITQKVLYYHRDTELYFPQAEDENGQVGQTVNESTDATLKKKIETN